MAEEYRIDVEVNAQSKGTNKVVQDMQKVAASSQAATKNLSSLEAAQRGLNQQVRKSDTERQTKGLDRVSAASLRYKNSVEESARAYQRLEAVRKTGTNAEQATATREMTSALSRQTSAFTALQNAQSAQAKSSSALMDKERKHYASVSTSIDDAIAARQRESSTFANSLRARLQGEAQAEAAARKTQAAQERQEARTNRARAGLRGFNEELDHTNLLSQRYVQYDLAQHFLTIAGAVTAAGAAVAVAFATQERAFTEAERILSADAFGQGPVAVAEMEQSVAGLRDELQGLSEVIPVSFGELSRIAAAGAALDIPAAQLDSFSETVAKFSAVTETTVDEAGMALARITQYASGDEALHGADKYNQLGSAILRLGNISIATEQQVLRYSQSLSPLSATAGVSAAQIVALSAATASFGNINVEGAGSAFTRVFAMIDRAVASGGEALSSFASQAGMSAEQFSAAWAQDSGGAFNEVLKGLNEDLPNLTKNLDDLGIKNVRDIRVIRALAVQYDHYARYLEEANTAVERGTALNDAYSFVADDLASKWGIFTNVLQNAAASVGEVLAPAFSAALGTATDLLKALGEFAGSPFGSWVVRIAGTLAGVLGAWAAWRGMIALTTGAMLAFRAASAFLAPTGSIGLAQGARTLADQIRVVGTTSTVAATEVAALGAASATAGGAKGVGLLRSGLRGVISFLAGPWGLGVLAGSAVVGTFVSQALAETDRLKTQAVQDLRDLADEVEGVSFDPTTIFNAEGRGIAEGAFAIPGVKNFFKNWANSVAEERDAALRDVAGSVDNSSFVKLVTMDLQDIIPAADALGMSVEEMYASLGVTGDQWHDFSAAVKDAQGVLQEAAKSGSGDFVASLKGLQTELGLTDAQLTAIVASDESLISSTLELGENLGFTGGVASILTQVLGDYENAAAGAAEGTDAVAAAQEAAAQQSEALREAFTEMVDAFKGFSTSTGDVQASIDSLYSVLNQSGDALDAFAEAGGNVQAVLEGGLDQASIDFRGSLSEINRAGFEAAAGILEAGGSAQDSIFAFDSARDSMQGLLEALNVDPAVAEEFLAGMYGSADQVRGILTDLALMADDIDLREVDIKFDADTGEWVTKYEGVVVDLDNLASYTATPVIDADTQPARDGIAYVDGALIEIGNKRVTPVADLGGNAYTRIPQISEGLRDIDGKSVQASVGVRYWTDTTGWHAPLLPGNEGGRYSILPPGFAGGGYTGQGGKYEPAGIVHKGEYVIPKHMVNQSTGLPFADALGKLVRGHETGIGYARGGYVSPQNSGISSTVSLTPGTIQMLARAVQTQISLDGRDLARSVNNANTRSNRLGG